MKPRGLLMMEHRLIEKMIGIIGEEIPRIKKAGKIDPAFIDTVVDFIRIYADRTHHGKEEDILFRDSATKDMSESDSKIMQELIQEHKDGRKTVGELVKAKEDYVKGKDTLGVILDKLGALADFYPRHIRKEDDVFFPDSEKYFSEEELQVMLKQCIQFDSKMIHEKYKLVVEQLKK